MANDELAGGEVQVKRERAKGRRAAGIGTGNRRLFWHHAGGGADGSVGRPITWAGPIRFGSPHAAAHHRDRPG